MRRILRVLSCTLAVSFLCPALFEAQTAPPVRDPRAVLMLQQSFAAMSNVAADDLKDSVVQARIRGRDDTPASAVTIKTRGRAVRIEAGTKAVVVNRGRSTQKDNATSPTWREARDPNAANKHADHLPAVLVAELLLRPDISLAYVAQEQSAGRQVHHLRAVPVFALPAETDPQFLAQLAKNATVDLFLDAETALPLKISFLQVSVTDWRRGAPVEIVYDDYRDYGGLKAPARQRRFFAGQFASELTLDTVSRNVGLVASDFTGRQ